VAKPGNRRGAPASASAASAAARLERVFAVIVEQVRQSPAFGQRLLDALGQSASGGRGSRPASPAGSSSAAPRAPAPRPPVPSRPAPKFEPPKPARQRRPAVIDPFALYDQGWESMLREHLSRLSVDQLHDVIDQFRLDPQARVDGQQDADALRDWIVRAVEERGLS